MCQAAGRREGVQGPSRHHPCKVPAPLVATAALAYSFQRLRELSGAAAGPAAWGRPADRSTGGRRQRPPLVALVCTLCAPLCIRPRAGVRAAARPAPATAQPEVRIMQAAGAAAPESACWLAGTVDAACHTRSTQRSCCICLVHSQQVLWACTCHPAGGANTVRPWAFCRHAQGAIWADGWLQASPAAGCWVPAIQQPTALPVHCMPVCHTAAVDDAPASLPTVPRLLGAPGWCRLTRVPALCGLGKRQRRAVRVQLPPVRLLALIRASSSSLFAADQSCACTTRRKVPPTGLACVAFALSTAWHRHGCCSFSSQSAAAFRAHVLRM